MVHLVHLWYDPYIKQDWVQIPRITKCFQVPLSKEANQYPTQTRKTIIPSNSRKCAGQLSQDSRKCTGQLSQETQEKETLQKKQMNIPR